MHTALSIVAACVLTMSPAYATDGRTVIDVKDTHIDGMTIYPGAAGNGTTDDTSAIQGKITFALASAANRNGRGCIIFFPEGTYRVTSTISVPSSAGVDFAGASANFSANAVVPSVILANFSSGSTPLFDVQGSEAHWTNLKICGRGTTSGTLPSELMYFHGGALNRVTFSRIQFFSTLNDTTTLGTGLSFGASSSESMNSEITFSDCAFWGFTTAIVTNSSQALDYDFKMTCAAACKTFLNVAYGGNVNFQTGTFSNCGGEGSSDWIFKFAEGGPNVGSSKIQNARFEAGCRQFVRVNGSHHVLLEGIAEDADGFEAAVLELGGGVLVVSNSRFCSQPVLNFTTSLYSWLDGNVRFRDCHLPTRTPGKAWPTAPSTPQAPPVSLLFTGTGKYTILECVSSYSGLVGYPLANATNVTGW
jgi:hypothetical protein